MSKFKIHFEKAKINQDKSWWRLPATKMKYDIAKARPQKEILKDVKKGVIYVNPYPYDGLLEDFFYKHYLYFFTAKDTEEIALAKIDKKFGVKTNKKGKITPGVNYVIHENRDENKSIPEIRHLHIFAEIKMSDEEKTFIMWLEQVKHAGLIEWYQYEPHSFVLAKKTVDLSKRIYTPDFLIKWTSSAQKVNYFGLKVGYCMDDMTLYKKNLLYSTFLKKIDKSYSYIEVKATFDKQNMTKLFDVKQAWIFQSLDILINLVKIGNKSKSFFDKTFVPNKFLFTEKTNKQKSFNFKAKTLNEYLVIFLLK